MRNRIPCQRDAGTRLATALRRRPFSACNKGNKRRLHAGNAISKEYRMPSDLPFPFTLPRLFRSPTISNIFSFPLGLRNSGVRLNPFWDPLKVFFFFFTWIFILQIFDRRSWPRMFWWIKGHCTWGNRAPCDDSFAISSSSELSSFRVYLCHRF